MNARRPAHDGAPLLVLVTGPPGTGKSTVAAAAADLLGAPVLAHDWAMSGLRPFPEVQSALDAMEPSGHRVVGWSLLGALARAQLREGRSVVLDGVARAAEVAGCRRCGRSEGARSVVIATTCSDRAVQRARVEHRRRGIPHWYELSWEQVERSLAGWEPPEDVDLVVDTAGRWEESLAAVRGLLGEP